MRHIEYLNIRINGRRLVEVHPENAPKVRRIFELYDYHNHTPDTLVAALLKEGIMYCVSKPEVGRSKLYGILTDRSYIGEIKFVGSGTLARTSRSWIGRPGNGRSSSRGRRFTARTR